MTAFNLRAARVNRGLSIPDLAAQLGLGRRVIERAESGQMPHPRNAKKIADFYGVQVTDIWPVTERQAA
jgi:ribosome-binding protein aMBF1 (putative translation factor)